VLPIARLVRVVAVNLGLCAVAILLAVGGAEVWFRLRWKPPVHETADRYVADDLLNHAFTPNFKMKLTPHPDIPTYEFRTNELGLRIDRPYSRAKPPKTKRIVVAGDSFVEGYLYENTIPARLEKLLAPALQARGWNLEVIHAGVGSYCPTLHYLAFKHKLLQLDPDLLVVAIDMTDTFDDWMKYRPIVQWDGDEPIAVPSEMEGVKLSLRDGMIRELPFYNVDYWVAAGSRWTYLGRYIFDRRTAMYMSKYDVHRKYRYGDHGFARELFDHTNAETRKRIEYSQEWIARTIALAKRHEVEVVVAMYPYLVQVRDPTLHGYFDLYRAHALEHGAGFHSALEAFLKEPQPETLYLRGDTHYNYEGQKVWARSLAEALAPKLEALTATASAR
jgi:hypothetical protein